MPANASIMSHPHVLKVVPAAYTKVGIKKLETSTNPVTLVQQGGPSLPTKVGAGLVSLQKLLQIPRLTSL
jgi:hypothetical protein